MLSCCVGGAAFFQAPELSFKREGQTLRLHLEAGLGTRYTIQSTADLLEWRPWVSGQQFNPVQDWVEQIPSGSAHRFFRAVQVEENSMRVPNFRLIDQTSRSHELYYETTRRAVVMVFVDFTCPEAGPALETVKSLWTRFESQGVLIWIIEGGGDADRSGLAAQSGALGLDMPVLHDRGHLVARGYGVREFPEAWVVDAQRWSLVYRGQIGGGGEQSGADITPATGFLANALERFLANQPIQFTQTPPGHCAPLGTDVPVPAYATEIAPVLQAKCIHCHSPGNIAPWSMTNHTIVEAYAQSIKQAVLTGEMPPWHADPQFGAFSNDASLEPSEAAALIRWIDAGTPRGAGADPLAGTAAPQDYPFAWPVELGPPDFVLTIPAQSVRATGIEPYHYVNVQTSFESDLWLRAAIVLPGNVSAVHHCLVYIPDHTLLLGLDGFFAGYVPGSTPTVYPKDTGKLLPKGATLQFQLHYTATGKPETDQTRIGLYVSKEPPKAELQTRSAFNVFFTIPPGAADHEVSGSHSFSQSVWLHELSPHMHYRGSRFRFEAVYPDGRRETLLNVPNYEFDWQALYRFAQPKFLPAGTTLLCVGAWDNSARNHENPDPTRTVTFGLQTSDEMFIGYFNYSDAE